MVARAFLSAGSCGTVGMSSVLGGRAACSVGRQGPGGAARCSRGRAARGRRCRSIHRSREAPWTAWHFRAESKSTPARPLVTRVARARSPSPPHLPTALLAPVVLGLEPTALVRRCTRRPHWPLDGGSGLRAVCLGGRRWEACPRGAADHRYRAHAMVQAHHIGQLSYGKSPILSRPS